MNIYLETDIYKVTYWVDFPSESANYHEDTDRKTKVICQMIQNKKKVPTDDECFNGLGKGNATISKEHIYQRFREITRQEHRV